MLEVFPGYLLIFLARVADVTCGTLRMLLLVRGRKIYAAIIGFGEVSLYVLAFTYLMGRLSDPLSLVFYAAGFAAGNIVGSLVEEKLALGFQTVQIISMKCANELTEELRCNGFGVTTVRGYGRDGLHHVLYTTANRKELPRVMELVKKWDEGAFVTLNDTRLTRGGVTGCAARKGK